MGDLPDAEVEAPENVLFVCKLNPVTTSEDLEIIFSRFGEIKSCEVICDQKSGESLQYAFIEFSSVSLTLRPWETLETVQINHKSKRCIVSRKGDFDIQAF